MRIAIVLPHLSTGGAQLQAVTLLGDLRERDHQVRLVLTDPDTEIPAQMLRLLKVGGAEREVVRIAANGFLISAYRRLLATLGSKRRTLNMRSGFLVDLIGKVLEKFFRKESRSAGWLIFFLLHKPLRARLRKIGWESAADISNLMDSLSLLVKADGLSRSLSAWKPDGIISFLTATNLSTVLAFSDDCPVVVCERNDVVKKPVFGSESLLRSALYPRASIITGNSPHIVRDLMEMFPLSNVQFFPNNFPQATATRDRRRNVFGMVCRLDSHKNVPLVVQAFLQSACPSRGWRLEIHGAGVDLPNVYRTIQGHKYRESVQVMGHSETPLEAMSRIDVLISASSYEGSSNVIHEAVSVGAMVLVAKTVGEYREIVSNKVYNATSFELNVTALTAKLSVVAEREEVFFDRGIDMAVDFREHWQNGSQIRQGFIIKVERLFRGDSQ